MMDLGLGTWASQNSQNSQNPHSRFWQVLLIFTYILTVCKYLYCFNIYIYICLLWPLHHACYNSRLKLRGWCGKPLFVAFHLDARRHCSSMNNFHGAGNVLGNSRAWVHAKHLSQYSELGIAIQVCQLGLGDLLQFLYCDAANNVNASAATSRDHTKCIDIDVSQEW